MDMESARREVIASGNELVARGLVARTWGNVSCRVDEDLFVITPSGMSYDRLTPESVVPVHIGDGSYEGDIKPSSEKGIHAAVYAASPETKFIVHTHQTCATCVSVVGTEGLTPTQEQLTLLGGSVKFAKYAMPGTAKLKRNTLDVLPKNGGVVLMERHGALITAASKDEAFRRAKCLEEVCAALIPDYDDKPLTPVFSVTRTEDGGRCVASDHRKEELEKAALDVCEEVFAAFPEISAIALLDTPAIRGAMQSGGDVPAVLDDFAQMIGVDGKVARAEKAARGLRGRNAVFVPGMGAFCCAGNLPDCEAIMTLAEKNALAIALAKEHGAVTPVPYIERRIMRSVYVKKYSKMK
jgi:L-fuculose-phosphate aldolase